jgi:hypothetical protein
VNTLIRLMPVIFACVAAQAFAGDPPTPAAVEPAKPATPAATADTTAPTNPAPVPDKSHRLVLDDKSLTQAEVNRLLAQGYKPQRGRGDNVLYCRSEAPLGSRLEKKVCLSADQIKAVQQDSKDITEKLQRNAGNPAGH